MPYFTTTSGFGPKALLANPGSVTWLLGGRVNGGTMYVTSVAIASNVATVGVTSWEGNLPVVGSLVSIKGTVTGSGEFNVTNVAVTGVTLDVNGTGTITFALTGANVGTTADAGVLVFNPQVVGEAVVAAASIPASPAFNQGRSVNTYSLETYFSNSGAATVVFQGAMTNDDAAFTTIAAVSGTYATNLPFIRVLLSSITAGNVAVGLIF